MFTLACKQVLHFRVRKCQPVKTFIRLSSHVKKIVRPIKTLIRQISHVKNIVCSETRILFQPGTTHKSLYSYNKVSHYGLSIYFLCYTQCQILSTIFESRSQSRFMYFQPYLVSIILHNNCILFQRTVHIESAVMFTVGASHKQYIFC